MKFTSVTSITTLILYQIWEPTKLQEIPTCTNVECEKNRICQIYEDGVPRCVSRIKPEPNRCLAVRCLAGYVCVEPEGRCFKRSFDRLEGLYCSDHVPCPFGGTCIDNRCDRDE